MTVAVALVPVPVFTRPWAAVPLAASAATAVTAATLTSGRRRRGPALTAAVGLVGLVLVTTALALAWRWPAAPARPSVIARSATATWRDLLTVGLPARPTFQLLVGPVIALWVLGYAGGLLAARTRVILAPLPPAVVGLGLALALAASRDTSARWPTTGFLAAAVALVAVRAGRARAAPAEARGRGRRAAARLAYPAALAAAAVAVSAAVPLAGRADPRRLLVPDTDAVSAVSPLDEVKSQLRTLPAEKLFTVHLVGRTASVDRVRIAALPDFVDDARWLDDSRFGVTTADLPDVEVPTSHSTARIVADIGIDALPAPFLPALDRPTRVEGPDVRFDGATGTLVTDAWNPGLRYRVTANVPRPSQRDLAGAVRASGPAMSRYQLPTTPPDWLLARARAVTVNARTPYMRLLLLQNYLRDPSRFPYNLDAAPGSSLASVQKLLRGEGRDREGYSEQHAAAFALLARALGFPTRIAVGYLLNKDLGSPAGTFTVTTRQAHAWPEVAFDGIGWIPFEPTDVRNLDLALPPPPFQRPEDSPGQTIAPSRPQPPLVQPDLTPRNYVRGLHLGPARVVALVLIVLVLIAAAIPLMVVATKALRRARRSRAPDPVGRVTGAWDEVLDRLAERNLPIPRSYTVGQVVRVARREFSLAPGGPAGPPGRAGYPADLRFDLLERIGSMVTAAWFAPAPPSTAVADATWELEREFADALARTQSWRGRVAARFSPRPLLSGRAGTPSPARTPAVTSRVQP